MNGIIEVASIVLVTGGWATLCFPRWNPAWSIPSTDLRVVYPVVS